MIVRFHQALNKSKNVIIITLGIIVIVSSLYILVIVNKQNYYANIKNNIKNPNTALLNNVYIIGEEKKEVNNPQKINNNDNKGQEVKNINNNIEQETNKIEPASVIVKDNTETKEVKDIDSVYVGLKFTGSMTAYGKDCCGTDPSGQGITASGYDLKQSLFYNDPIYGIVRIVASDRNFKLYSVIKVDDPIDGSYNAIVLDRAGSVIGLNKTKKFDLAVESESFAASKYGVHINVKFEVLRVGK